MCVRLVHVINVMSTFPTVNFSGVKLHVESAQSSVFAVRGGNTTMPCRFWYEPELSSPREVRVKWSWLPAAGGHHETDVLVAVGSHSRSFGEFRLLKGQIMNLWSFFWDISGCMTLLSINSQLLVVFRSGVACSSDRISREMLHSWWQNSSWMIQAATAARWWTDWRTRALQFIWSYMVHNVHLHLHLHKAYF